MSFMTEIGSQKELAEHLGISPAALAVSLGKLEAGEYVAKEVSDSDSRVKTITITEKGRALVADSKRIFDGIDDEMLILQSFANGLMVNLSDMSDSSLTSSFTSINKKLVKTNITKDDVLAHTEVIRGYGWFKIQTLTYPGKFISGKAGREGFYNPDIDAAISYFANYR